MRCIVLVMFLCLSTSIKSQNVRRVLQTIFTFDPSSSNFEKVKYRLNIFCDKKEIYEEDYNKFVVMAHQLVVSLLKKELQKKVVETNICLGKYINNVRIHEEIIESQKTGSMEVAFKKYCDQYPQMLECLKNMTDSLEFCLGKDTNLLYNGTLQFVNILKEYLCFKDGIRLAIFILQGGKACIDEQQENIEKCFQKNSEVDYYSMRPSLEVWYNLTQWDPSFCSDLSNLRFCVYDNLIKCNKSVPANIVDAFYKYLRKMFLCRNETNGKKDTGHLWIQIIVIAVDVVIVALIVYKLAK